MRRERGLRGEGENLNNDNLVVQINTESCFGLNPMGQCFMRERIIWLLNALQILEYPRYLSYHFLFSLCLSNQILVSSK